MSKKKFLLDSLLNIVSMAIPIMVLQFFTLPAIGRNLGSEHYGIVVTLISLFTVVSFPFGNVLTNVRLLLAREYTEKKVSGDFNLLLLSSLVFSTIMLSIGTIYYDGHFSIMSIVFIIFIGVFNLTREYLSVSFRLQLNYKLILMNNVMLSVGYLVGTILFLYTETWQYVFVAGYGLSLFHIIKHTNLYKEPLKITVFFKATTYKSIILLCSSLLRNVLSYADKLLLFPLLGPTAVTIYYTATIVSKIMLMAITPINGVILSYLAKMEKISIRTFLSIIGVTGFIGMIGYVLTIFLSPFVLNTFYKSWAAESLKYIYITSAIGIVEMLISVINPFILKFNNIN